MSINRVCISGNLTRDPELRATASGTQVLTFGIAVNDRRRNQQTGEWDDYPNFVDCTMFGNRALALSRILRKGIRVAVEGKLRYSSWERDGQRRSKIEVIPDEVELMSQGHSQNAQQGGYAPQQAPQAYAPQQQAYAPQAATQAAPQPAPQPAPQWTAQQAYQNPPAVPQPSPQAAPQVYAPQPAPQAAPAPQQAETPAQQQMDVYDGDIPF